MAEIIDRIKLCDDGIRVTLKLTVPCSQAGMRTSSMVGLTRFVSLAMKRRGVETRIVISGGTEPPRTVDPALLKAVSSAVGVPVSRPAEVKVKPAGRFDDVIVGVGKPVAVIVNELLLPTVNVVAVVVMLGA